MALKLSRQRARKRTLDQFKHVRTCILARELCLLVRTNRAILNTEDACDCCSYISKLCGEAGCEETSDLCAKAAEEITGSEEDYLKICEQSCGKCGETKQPNRPAARLAPDRNIYVA